MPAPVADAPVADTDIEVPLDESSIQSGVDAPDITPVTADDATQTTLAIIKPDAFESKQHIIQAAQEAGFTVAHSCVTHLDAARASKFYSEHYGKNFFGSLVEFMTSGECVVLALRKENAVADWRALIGPTSSLRARESAPDSIRAKFGTDNTKNAVHGSATVEEAVAELGFFFPKYYLYQRTICYVLPTVDMEKHADIEAQFAAWQFKTIATEELLLGGEKASPICLQALAEQIMAGSAVSTDPSEDEGSYLMPYAMRAHDPSLDEPPAPPKQEGEEEEPEPPAVDEPADGEDAAPGEDAAAPVTLESLTEALGSGVVKVYMLGRYGAVHAMNKLAGPCQDAKGHPETAGTLNGMMSTTNMPSVYCPSTPAEVLRHMKMLDKAQVWKGLQFTEVERTLAIIKPNAYNSAAVIRKLIDLNGFTVEDESSFKMTDEQATEFYKEHEDKEFFPDLKQFMTSGNCIALVLSRPGAIPVSYTHLTLPTKRIV
eukprot:TRINITY_DN8543_c0_g1_i7.p1 TRINITY_DN8543_c0_g1~~TRINITY_DN8543_c0_g1_i7.p1  ORF type:complete len:488 (+),score=150.19 TRINITY_DN8543_c0_g1_i7:70-1533(+)